MSRRGIAAIVLGLVGCASDVVPVRDPVRVHVARSTSIPDPAPTLPPPGAPFPSAKATPPAWLDPDVDVRKSAFRTRVVRLGKVYGDDRNPPIADGGGVEANRVEIVVEAPATSNTPRVPVLCATHRERVMVQLERADLAFAARKGAMMAARRDDVADATRTPRAYPGFALDAGIDVGVKRGTAVDAVVAATFRDGALKVDGFVDVRQLDEVWESNGYAAGDDTDAQLPHGATFLDAPRGAVFARLPAPAAGAHQEAWIAPGEQHGMVFARTRVYGGVIGGWVPKALVLRRSVPIGRGDGRLDYAGHYWQKEIEMPRGTTLHLGAEPIGVVVSTTRYPCVRFCGDSRPLVKVRACGVALELVAALPPGEGARAPETNAPRAQ